MASRTLDSCCTTVEMSLTGESFWGCGVDSDAPVAAWFLTLLFFTFGGLLLLNMLIAMMAKTFENIADASAINFQMLIAMTTMSIDEQPPASPPLSLLTIPFDLLVLVLRLALDPRGKRLDEEVYSLVFRGNGQDAMDDLISAADDPDATAAKRKQRTQSSSLKLQKGEQAARAMFQLREVETYMSLNMDDVVQEASSVLGSWNDASTLYSTPTAFPLLPRHSRFHLPFAGPLARGAVAGHGISPPEAHGAYRED